MTISEPVPRVRERFSHCFGCGPDNPVGFKLKVTWDGEKACAEFVPGENHTGMESVVHGGVLCVLLDEVMSYVTYDQGLLTVTGKMEARFLHPVRPGEPLLVTAWATRHTSKLVKTQAIISRKDNTVVAEGLALMFVVGQIEEDRGGQ